jgi:DNA polymerase beta
MSNKQGIIDNFNILIQYYKSEGNYDQHRLRAYNNAVKALKALDVKDITNIEQLKDIRGIGKGTIDKVNQYLSNGFIQEVEDVKKELKKDKKAYGEIEKQTVIDKLSSILGVGPAAAIKWWDKGIRSIDDLKRNKDISLTKTQKIGLKYYKDLHTRIPREQIKIFELMVKTVLAHKFGIKSFKMEAAGSYRRGALTSGDIDILFTSTKFNLNKAVKVLEKWGIIVDTISMKSEKFMGIAHCPNNHKMYYHLDLVYLPEDEYESGLLWFTGSKGFNINMRAKAKQLGLVLNQHGLFDDRGNRIPAYTEYEIMKELGMKWFPPEKR